MILHNCVLKIIFFLQVTLNIFQTNRGKKFLLYCFFCDIFNSFLSYSSLPWTHKYELNIIISEQNINFWITAVFL